MVNNQRILKIFSTPDVKHGLSLFSSKEINAVERQIMEQDEKIFIKCQIKDKYKIAKPEEIIRQLWIYRLLTEYGYSKERIDVERVIYFGSRDSGLADIVVFHEDITHHYIILEVKRPSRTAGLEQLKSYCNAEGAPIGVWSNGNEIILLHREEPNIFTSIPRLPKTGETLEEVLTEKWNIIWLEINDELKKGENTLKKIILDLEELALGNAGVESTFNELFKLIYSKLYDEWRAITDPKYQKAVTDYPRDIEKVHENPEYIRDLPNKHPLRNLYQLEFHVGGRSPSELKRAIDTLFERAKDQWSGVFEGLEEIKLEANHLKVCVSFLEKIKLFNSNLRIIDDAFEYLIPQEAKKKEGQFFTPRPVVDMVVKMLNPKYDEFIIDPACGSCGFTLHSIMWVAEGRITGKGLPEHAKDFAQNRVFGMDFGPKAIKVAKAINLIAGDGKANVYYVNSLAPHLWNTQARAGLNSKLLKLRNDPKKDKENQERLLYFNFDVLMTNPPFAGTVKEREILRLYELAEKNGKLVNKIGRHILFLNRSLQFIKPGGRMAIVLPQGIFNNTTAEYIRRWFTEEARILAVVGLHVNTFKPHTGTKTSVLFLQKYTDEERLEIQKIRAKYMGKWDDFFNKLKKKYQDLAWDKPLDEEELPEELKSFIDTYFESREEMEEEQNEEAEDEESTEVEDKKGNKSLKELVVELREIQGVLNEKEEELSKVTMKREKELEKETKVLNARLKKLHKEISQKTLAGQVYLVFNDEKITNHLKKYWLDSKVVEEMDYPIFFAVNKKPLKDNTGEYRYEKGPNGEVLPDEYGHPIIDHDLEEIAERFVKFAIKQGFNFWKE